MAAQALCFPVKGKMDTSGGDAQTIFGSLIRPPSPVVPPLSLMTPDQGLKIYVTQHNWKVPVIRKLDIELRGCKVKISQNMVPKSILRFHMFWNLQNLIVKLIEGFGAKTMFSRKN